jgi:ParB/RepB/Spo0J family partition protein
MNPGAEKGYALDFLTVVRHVATEMESVRPGGALSIDALAASYDHSIPGDLTRVRHHHDLSSDEAAKRFLVERAVNALNSRNGKAQVGLTDDGWQLLKPLADVRYERKKVHPLIDPHKQLRAPFDPMTGEFSENIRRNTGKDSMDELRESMREFGWIVHLPAIQDERGVIIMGHRRLAVAQELGIEPNIKPFTFGDGDEGDARRLKLAIASNLGAKPFTPEERARIAEYLYGEREWSEERIAQALNVSQPTVSRDLELFTVNNSSKAKRGRPRNLTSEQQQRLIEAYFDDGKTQKEAAEEAIGRASASLSSVTKVIDHERGRREAIAMMGAAGTRAAASEKAPSVGRAASTVVCTCAHCPVHCPT